VKDSTGNLVEIVSVRSGESRRLALPGRQTERYDLSWSPDGRYFSYVDAHDLYSKVTRLWVLGLEDEESFVVTDGLANDWSPSWSSDGRTLYFVSDRGGSMDLWHQPLGLDGTPEGNPKPVTVGIGMRRAVFSPDGTKLVYSKGRSVGNLWRVPIFSDRPATWADAVQLTFDEAYIEAVDISPDGERLLVDSDRAGNPDIWMLSAEGGELQQLTLDTAPEWGPKWSPDGEEFAFYAYRNGNRDIWIKPAGIGPARRITHHEAEDMYPAWSPDGRELAFHSDRGGQNWDIWIISAEGGEARRVTEHPSEDFFAQWSSDGEWLLFHSNRTGDHLWLVPASGGEPEQLTEGPSGWGPRWSLDGKQVYFPGAGQRTGNLWASSIHGGSERPLTELQGRRGTLGLVSLATDGQYLYFTWMEELGDLWVMDVVEENRE
jgi:Tol biopolymer transport system component